MGIEVPEVETSWEDVDEEFVHKEKVLGGTSVQNRNESDDNRTRGDLLDNSRTIETFLDSLGAEREEWKRVQEDLYPEETRPSKPITRRTHKASDPIQTWLTNERHT